MYSTDIVGLQKYRTQQNISDDSDTDTALTTSANSRAEDRRNELIQAFQAAGFQAKVLKPGENVDL